MNTTVLAETYRLTTTTTTDAFIQIELISLAPHPRNVRRSLADLRDLTRSIRNQGIETLLVVMPADGLNSVP